MYDLKLFASKRPDLMRLLTVSQTFSNDIRMEFGVDTCASMYVVRGSVIIFVFQILLPSKPLKYMKLQAMLQINETENRE